MNRPRIKDPGAIPVTGRDGHLPAIPADRLTVGSLRQRFAQPPIWTPEFLGDGLVHATRAPTMASVLVALVPLSHPGGDLQVLLTRRTDHLRDHAGQISFPGGRAEAEDASTADTALREAQEEVGLHREQIEVLGELPRYTTVTNFVVTPVVALLRSPLDLQSLALDSGEVAEVFQVPMGFLMDPSKHQRHHCVHLGDERCFLSMPWQNPQRANPAEVYFIWGATAAMLRNLYRFLAAT